MARLRNNDPTKSNPSRLETEKPLCEKDEQGRVMERMRQLQQDALEVWRAILKKRK